MSESLPAVPGNLDTLTAEILILKRQTAVNLIEIGMRLNQVKEVVGHGNWGAYLQNMVNFSERTAQMFMRVAREFAANPQAIADLDSTKVYAVMEADPEDRPALLELAPSATTRQLQEAKRAMQQARDEAEEAKRLTAEARREATESGRRMEKAIQRAEAAEAREPKVIEKTLTRTVNQDTPETKATVQRLARELTEERRQHNELLAKADGTAEAQRGLDAARKQVEATQRHLQRLSVQFDDEGRDQYGGSKLMDATEPIQGAIAKALAEVRVLKRVGVGGACDDDTLKALLPQLRELADSLDEILKDRASRPINVTPTEVM